MTAAEPSPPTVLDVVLDLDGTLLPGLLGTQFLNDLIADDVCDPTEAAACLRALDRYERAALPRATTTDQAYRHYAAAMRGAPRDRVDDTAARTWSACRPMLFPFVGPLLELLAAYGCRIHLVSANADPPIQQAVQDLHLTWGRGALMDVQDDRFTGQLTTTPGLPGGKSAVMHELAQRWPFDRRRAIAIGNTAADAEVFSLVDHPLAFEPDTELRTLCDHHGWTIVDRDTVVDACARIVASLHDARSA